MRFGVMANHQGRMKKLATSTTSSGAYGTDDLDSIFVRIIEEPGGMNFD